MSFGWLCGLPNSEQLATYFGIGICLLLALEGLGFKCSIATDSRDRSVLLPAICSFSFFAVAVAIVAALLLL